MRRADLDALGIRLPVLPAIALGALPGPHQWARRLLALGLDVVQSGAAEDSPDTVASARAAVPWGVLKARPGPAAELVAAGAVLLETDAPVPAGAYRLDASDGVVVCGDSTSATVEDPNDIAAQVVAAARGRSPADLWVAAAPGLDALSVDVVEAKLAALVDGTRQARLAIAKVQFEDDEFFAR